VVVVKSFFPNEIPVIVDCHRSRAIFFAICTKVLGPGHLQEASTYLRVRLHLLASTRKTLHISSKMIAQFGLHLDGF